MLRAMRNKTVWWALVAVLGLASFALVSCDGDESGGTEEGTGGGGGDTDEGDPGDDASAAARRQLATMRLHLGLMATAHLADVDHHGLYMDFGTPARMHYTMGRWHSGFLRDVTAGERDFTRIGTDARAWFHVDEAEALTLRFRGRPQGSRNLTVYLNGRQAGVAMRAAIGGGRDDAGCR